MTTEEKLQTPFDSEDIEWRIGRSGEKNGKIWATALAYVSNRAIMNRLDSVFGSINWQNKFKEWHGESQLCGISVRHLDSDGCRSWVTKWDGADNTNFESTKGGLSDSMKRAAVQWGIGRYLYRLPETFVEVSDKKIKNWNYATTKEKKSFYWKEPELPAFALPDDKLDHKLDVVQRIGEIFNLEELKEFYNSLSKEDKETAKPYVVERGNVIKMDKEVADG